MKTTALIFAAPFIFASISHARAPQIRARSWVQLQASTDQKRYTVGQPIKVQLRATNIHTRGAYLRFTSGQRFDFQVFRVGTKDTVYTWSAARMFTQNMGSLWLIPKQTQKFEAEIGDEMGQLKPGKYRLVARLSNSPRPIVAAPVEFEIAASALDVQARTDKKQYRVGETVKIKVDVVNRLGKEQTANINWGMVCDVRVRDAMGRDVWTHGANIRFVRMLGPTKWAAKETKSLDFTWNGTPLPFDYVTQPLAPGRYTVEAWVPTEATIVSPPAMIEIVN